LDVGEENMNKHISSDGEVEFYKRYYTQFAGRYDSYVCERSRIVARCLLDWVDLDDKDVLDLGVGTASVWEDVNETGSQNVSVVGVDIVPVMLEVARKKKISWLKLREENIETYEDKERYDLVLASSILRHLPDPSTAVSKAYGFLVGGGKFLIEDHMLKDSHYQILPRVTNEIAEYWRPVPKEDSFMMNEEDMLDLISGAGFEIERYEEFRYVQRYYSLREFMDFLIDNTMWGMSYRRIEKGHRKKCDDIFLGMLREVLREPVLERWVFVCLLSKKGV
jgi:ubiquinone/menaquinone biosynthesis C-methylase UbiE